MKNKNYINHIEENFDKMENKEIDNGLELLKKVIKSNEENIEKLTDIAFFYEDILNLVGKFEVTARDIIGKTNDFETKIPKNIQAELSENTLLRLEYFEKKSKILKYSLISSFSFLGITILVMFLSFYFSKQWYVESIKTKEEIKTQIFEEMRNKGKDFYEIKQVNRLKMNTEIINKWIEKNPKEGSRFLQFKEGYETK